MAEKGNEKSALPLNQVPPHRPRRRGSRAGVAARTQPKPNRTESLFFKTKICAFWLESRCLRGSGCKYAHGDDERHAEPDLTKTALCRKMLSGGECKDPNCTYAHTRDELRSTADVYKTSMCTFFKYGRCQMGSSCRHAHFESELRSNKEIAALDMCKPVPEGSELEDSDDDMLNEVDTKWERSITMPPAIGQQQPQRERAIVKGITPTQHHNWADMTEEAEDEDDDDFFDDSLWARMSTTPAPTTSSQDQVPMRDFSLHRNGPGILEAPMQRQGPTLQVPMMNGINGMNGMLETNGVSNGVNSMQMPVPMVACAPQQCQQNVPCQGMPVNNGFVQGVNSPVINVQGVQGLGMQGVQGVQGMVQGMQGVQGGGYVQNMPAMAIVVPVPVPVMVMPQGAEATGCGMEAREASSPIPETRKDNMMRW